MRRRRPGGPRLLTRRDGTWDEHLVAAHLMSCRQQMVIGLRRRPPWAGMDPDSLESCFVHGAALIAAMASSGARPEWRSVPDLEKAQVAAFRFQALDHWKHVNAQVRRGDHLTVAFDPDRHAVADPQIERLFEQQDLFAIKRDLLAEIGDPAVVAFWRLVLDEELRFKAAGDRLGLTKAEVMARTRAGRSALAAYLARRDSGELCRERGGDIAARSAGVADPAAEERAAAHLDACYACALVHLPRSSAFERGILTIAPVGLLWRFAGRLGEASSSVGSRWAQAGPAARVAAAGMATLAVAWSGFGVTEAAKPDRREAAATTLVRQTPPAPREAFRAPAPLVQAAVASKRQAARAAASSRTPAKGETPGRAATSPGPVASQLAPPASPPASTTSEFSFERGGANAPAAPAPPSPQTAAPAAEFHGP